MSQDTTVVRASDKAHRDALDGTQLFTKSRVQVDVCVALYSVTTLPVPVILPSDVSSTQRDQVGTTLARLCVALAPLVDVEGVLACDD